MESSAPHPGAIDESILVAGLRSGEPHAFELLVRQQTMPMLRVARRLLRSEEDARDAVQEAFISVVRSIGRFEAGSLLSTWLHRIVVNACLMRLRAMKRKPTEDIEDYLPTFKEDGHQNEVNVPWVETAETVLQRTELCALVRSCIDQLPETYRVVLMLRDIEELSTDETAQMLGATPNAVKVRLHRARQALRTLLDPHMRSR